MEGNSLEELIKNSSSILLCIKVDPAANQAAIYLLYVKLDQYGSLFKDIEILVNLTMFTCIPLTLVAPNGMGPLGRINLFKQF